MPCGIAIHENGMYVSQQLLLEICYKQILATDASLVTEIGRRHLITENSIVPLS